jgi:phosphoribosylformylglycinamidine (FGAM) synthase PurS component
VYGTILSERVVKVIELHLEGDRTMTRDQLQILENQLVANCQYQGIQPTIHKLLENLFDGKSLDGILKDMLE